MIKASTVNIGANQVQVHLSDLVQRKDAIKMQQASNYLRKAVLISTKLNQPYISRQFTKDGLIWIQKSSLTAKQKISFPDLIFKRAMIRTHDSINKDIVDLLVVTNTKKPVFIKSKREKEVMIKLLKNETIFEYLSIATIYIQAIDCYLEKK